MTNTAGCASSVRFSRSGVRGRRIPSRAEHRLEVDPGARRAPPPARRRERSTSRMSMPMQRPQDLGAAVHLRAEGGLGVVQPARHLRVLVAHAGKEEGDGAVPVLHRRRARRAPGAAPSSSAAASSPGADDEGAAEAPARAAPPAASRRRPPAAAPGARAGAPPAAPSAASSAAGVRAESDEQLRRAAGARGRTAPAPPPAPRARSSRRCRTSSRPRAGARPSARPTPPPGRRRRTGERGEVDPGIGRAEVDRGRQRPGSPAPARP